MPSCPHAQHRNAMRSSSPTEYQTPTGQRWTGKHLGPFRPVPAAESGRGGSHLDGCSAQEFGTFLAQANSFRAGIDVAERVMSLGAGFEKEGSVVRVMMLCGKVESSVC